MRGLQRSAGLLAVALAWVGLPGVGQAGWITLAAGTLGSAQPTDVTEFWCGSASTPPLVAIGSVSGTGNIEAVTGGGTALFSGLGTPVLLDLTDGSAYLTGGVPPSGAVAGRLGADALASAAPQTGAPVPPDYAQLGIALATSDAGERVLTVSVLGTDGRSGAVVVPEGGWWVLGLRTGQEPTPEPVPEPEPTPEPTPEPVPPPAPAPGVPEPTAMVLAASGAFVAVPWARRRRRIGER